MANSPSQATKLHGTVTIDHSKEIGFPTADLEPPLSRNNTFPVGFPDNATVDYLLVSRP